MTSRPKRRLAALAAAVLLVVLGLSAGNARLGAAALADQERFVADRGIGR